MTKPLLRKLLRQLRPGSEPLAFSAGARYLVSKYRLPSMATTNPQKLERLKKLAADYHKLLCDVADRSRLHKLDTGAEEQLSPMELSRRAAARAGLQLPETSGNELR